MGRRRDKVRWSQVDLNQEKTPSVPIVPPQEAYSTQQKPPTELSGDRRYPHRKPSSSLAPRFAKKSSRSEAINSKEADCSVEELPDGYIKIRSKNLDIIFKKEFYHKRMMELQVRGITPNKIKEEWNDASLSKSSSMNIPGNSEDPASVTVASTLSFNDLDLDEIPEFRPRLGTDGGSINDSGYSSSFQESFCYDKQPLYPPLPGPVFLPPPNLPPPPLASQQMCPFFLFSAATNTLIPCEEVLVHKTLDTPGGQVFQGYTKAYVAYPVQGPEGRGYIMQPFSLPPELSSSPEREREKIEGDSEVVKEDEVDSSYKEVLTKSSTQLKPEERTRKIGHVILPNVYIPGLPPSEMRAKKKRRKKPKAKSDQAPRLPSSSESDAKEFEPVNYPRTPETEELYEFINEEPVNEINLTDDLTNSLLNPPTEDDEMESSAIVREILNLVETDEDSVEVAPRVEAEELLEEPNLADAAESEAEGDIKPTKETIINPKPKSTKPQTKQTQKKLKKNPEPKIAHLMDVLLSLQPSTSAPALVTDQEDKNFVEQGLEPEASSNAFTEEETKPKQDPILATINETEVKPEKVEDTTATENRGCHVSDFDELCLEEAEHSPPPNVPAVRSKIRDSKGRRRKKRSSKEVKGEENPSKKVLVMDNQLQGVELDFHDAWVRGNKESVVWIKELGYGMDRGVMGLERLFQGHYVPPARGEHAMKEEKEVEPVMIDTLEVE